MRYGLQILKEQLSDVLMSNDLGRKARWVFGMAWMLALLTMLVTPPAHADRVKDLASLASVRANQLLGYGLVVGLEGTGDGADLSVTATSMKSILSQLGVNIDNAAGDFDRATAGKMDVKNVAAVMVTAELPGFAKPGQRIDVNVSAIGKAKSLRGGNLILTSLRGVDGQVYALAQGPLTATGVREEAAASRVTLGVPTAARIPNGAIVERTVPTPFENAEFLVMNVHASDFSTTTSIVNAINQSFGGGVAEAIDATSIAIRSPANPSQRVAFMSEIENLNVTPGEPPARVIVNSRTGTVVISRNVKVTAAAVSHGTISVMIAATNEVSQPAPLAEGDTAAVQNADVAVQEDKNPMFLFQPGVDLRQIVDAVNQVGATPSALIAILEALKSSGSLRAELVVI
jgi:flagellar P-ring protein precursor FlgI